MDKSIQDFMKNTKSPSKLKPISNYNNENSNKQSSSAPTLKEEAYPGLVKSSIKKPMNIIEEFEDCLLCDICFLLTNEVNYFCVIDCGHSLCFSCFENNRINSGNYCPLCNLAYYETPIKNYKLIEILNKLEEYVQCRILAVAEKKVPEIEVKEIIPEKINVIPSNNLNDEV